MSIHNPKFLIAAGAAVCAFVNPLGRASDLTLCGKVSASVHASIARQPQKILVIVEDAMVANETCACEIVKAAILESKANHDLIKQIVLTATNVSPRMTAVIAECASTVAQNHSKEDHSKEVHDYSKEVMNYDKQPASVIPPTVVPPTGPPDYSPGTGQASPLFLAVPSAGGAAVVVNRTPPTSPTPQSPSMAKQCPKNP